jgi:hypothetical protein
MTMRTYWSPEAFNAFVGTCRAAGVLTRQSRNQRGERGLQAPDPRLHAKQFLKP